MVTVMYQDLFSGRGQHVSCGGDGWGLFVGLFYYYIVEFNLLCCLEVVQNFVVVVGGFC